MRTLLFTILCLALSSCVSMKEKGIEPVTSELLISEEVEIKDFKEEIKPGEDILDLALRYEVKWAAMHVADIIMDIKPVKAKIREGIEHDMYRVQVFIESQGLAKLVSGFKSNSITLVNRENSEYAPADFKTSFMYWKKRRDITISYSDDGSKIIAETNTPPEKTWKRKPVPEELKSDSYDPITVGFAARKKIMAIDKGEIKDKKFTLPVYDGRRRTDIEFNVLGRTEEENFIHATFKEIAVAGYTDNELKELNKQDSEVHLFISSKNYLPVSIEGKSVLGTSRATIKKKCDSLKECLDN